MDVIERDGGGECVAEFIDGAWTTHGCDCEACREQRDVERERAESDVPL